MSSTEASRPLAPAERAALIAVARRAIEHGLTSGRPLTVSPSEYHPDLKTLRASFVTLHRGGELRGCIGHLEAVQPLDDEVAENAYSAAKNGIANL